MSYEEWLKTGWDGSVEALENYFWCWNPEFHTYPKEHQRQLAEAELKRLMVKGGPK